MTGSWQRTKRILETAGHMSGGLTRTVTARTCHTCHAPVLAALAGERVTWPVRCDPTPLSPAGEALAVLTGRYTCALVPGRGTALELHLRDSFHITGTPAGTRVDVLPQHACGAPPLPTAPSVLPRRPHRTQEATTCPF